MKKKVLVISLLALSGALIASGTPTPQYEFSGKKAIKCLIRNGQCRNCDLSNQDLRAAMADVNLKFRNRFMFTNLSGANLSGANLSGTDLSFAIMRDANLTGADLSNANMHGANMNGANLTGANLSNANMHGATMRNVNMTDANMTGAKLIYALLYNVNMTGADITGADMTNAEYLDTVIGYTSKK